MLKLATPVAMLLGIGCFVAIPILAVVAADPASDSSALDKARRAMILHASFDDVVDLNLFTKDGWMYTADSTLREKPRVGAHADATIAKGEDKFGDALQFNRKTDQVVFYQGSLYLNGKLQGAMTRPMQFTWEPKQVGVMLGIHYVGLMDDLMIFNQGLDAQQVELLYQHPVAGLR